MLYADIILPLLPDRLFTYRIPEDMTDKAVPGMRAVIQFGNRKLYTGIIKHIHQNPEKNLEYKTISSLPDDKPIINNYQLDFWDWMADYYICSTGEIYKAALPSGLKPESESRIICNEEFTTLTTGNKNTDALLVIIQSHKIISLTTLSRITGKKDLLPELRLLADLGAIKMDEKLRENPKQAMDKFIALSSHLNDSASIHKKLDELSGAPKQKQLLTKFLELAGDSLYEFSIPYKIFFKNSGHSIIKSLLNKNVFHITEKPATTLSAHEPSSPVTLNIKQLESLKRIKEIFKEKDVCLLHGVTSSGKTEIYIHLISDIINEGKQVLYLLPEIALTAQIVERLRTVFGNKVGIYHSRFSDKDRINVYNSLINDTSDSYSIILGARSSVFLPFTRLGLVIVDEEHENSYKQYDPSPRYNARDSSIVLATLHKAKVLLGTATPSVETWANCRNGKYGLVQLNTRFGELKLPKILITNIRDARQKNRMKSVFTPFLLDAISDNLSRGKQVILFQNRRGYSSYLQCNACGWIPRCKSCDVSLTYHKYLNSLICHYCGFTRKPVAGCDECNSTAISTKGFGTELIEDEIGLLLPEARAARLDLDTSRSVKSYVKILNDFSTGKTNILVGTQMISKGLDFEKVGLVGIINADQMLNYPEFRSHERSFQLMMQVSGRAGRKDEQGKVIIQTTDPAHPIIRFVRDNNLEGFYREEYEQRQAFNYPPFVRMIRITLKHKNADLVNKLAVILGNNLRIVFGKRVLGPHDPIVGRIQSYYLKNILMKIEKRSSFKKARMLLRKILKEFQDVPDAGKVRISVDVDPV